MSDLPHPVRPGSPPHLAPCPIFARHLSDLIEGACSLELGAWLGGHPEVCDDCGRALALARALRRTLRGLGRQEPSARFRLALTSTLVEHQRRTRRSLLPAWRR